MRIVNFLSKWYQGGPKTWFTWGNVVFAALQIIAMVVPVIVSTENERKLKKKIAREFSNEWEATTKGLSRLRIAKSNLPIPTCPKLTQPGAQASSRGE